MSALFKGRNRPSSGAKSPLHLGRLAQFLRRIEPLDTAAVVAAETGIAEETIRNWLKGRNGLQAGHLIALTAAYGPDALAAAFGPAAPAWLDSACRAARAAAIEARIAELERERARLAGG